MQQCGRLPAGSSRDTDGRQGNDCRSSRHPRRRRARRPRFPIHPRLELPEGGTGVPEDAQQAFSWFRQAAEQGHSGAQYCLSLMYENGDGVQPDAAQAFAWCRKAAEQAHTDARHSLA
ncbi:MAG: sel1 repeat family protein [Alphaproteobacteria bacterium]|nr:sel1 repeat family protein [Alphaproteobacteria bacterium]